MAERLLIKGGTVITVDPELGDLFPGDVLIEDGAIAAVGPSLEVEDAEAIDAADCIVMPGFVDTHRHTWQALFRNIASDWTLAHYFTGLHGTLSELYRPEDTYASNLIGTLEALDSGITTLLDWSHNLNTPDHTDAAIDALVASGSRVVFGHGGGHQHWQPVSALPHPADDVRRLREGRLSSDDALVTLCLAPRGNQFATMEVTEQDWRVAEELGLRISCHFGDGEWGRNRPVAQLAARGLLGPTMTFVHCNTLADDELAMMADAGCTASISPDIELQMGHGWPATGRLVAAGIRPSLSIDVCCSNGGHMFGTLRATIGTQRGFDNEAAHGRGEASVSEMELTCRDVLEFATIEGARACGLEDRVGSLTPGKRGDLILIRTDSFGMTPLNNPVGQVVYNAHPGLVDTVIVDGRVVKRAGALEHVDAGGVRQLAIDSRDDILGRADARSGARIGGSWIPAPYEVVEATA
jgi:5-methylthioadenosine/S-adenosylhomocysteine deaminase